MLAIERVDLARRDEWLRAAERCPSATYFHSPRWAEIFSRSTDGHAEPAALAATLSDGMRAVLPLVRVRRARGLLTLHLASAAGTYGGWISTDPLGAEHARLLADRLLAFRDLVWRENPFDPLADALPMPGAREEWTQLIDLAPGIDALYAKTTHAHKKALKKAEREGVTVRKAAGGDDWRAYYGIYEEALAHWKTLGPEKRTRARYGWEIFRIMHEEPAPEEALWLAEKDGRIVAGIICFEWAGRHIVTWHAAALAEYNQFRPNNALYWEIICDAQRRGLAWFDFNPSGGYEGVVSFKDNFGGESRRARIVDRRSWARALAGRLRR